MIPGPIESHLRESHRGFEHHTHRTAMSAQELASAEHVSGHRVAKPVVVSLDGLLAFAVVAATDRVSLAALEEATGRPAELVPESEFSPRFQPCEAGAEPPLAMFGVPIFVDEKLLREEKLVMPGGTHEDSIVLATSEWMRCEGVTPIAGLGTARTGRSDFGG
ncbi:MAG TPA: YbaK/EbsC family protein [Anaeromyxobacter sp.]|jgi:Ala-tRNA(Pro) deacylase|nr:YbaK/EbsC family protein [Anaeromyxobacter sp.]